MLKNPINPLDLDQEYLEKLAALVRRFENERKERFFPFYLIFSGKREDRRFNEALSIGKYFLDHAFLNSEKDERFFNALKNRLKKYPVAGADYWQFAEKTPIPLQDYLKVVYDL
jgi:hypothetical protein